MFDELEKTFSTKVEDRVKETGEGYMEAVNLLCEELELEQELVAKYLSKPIIERIKAEAQRINLLPRGPQLFPEEL
jgi:hypothetical protein